MRKLFSDINGIDRFKIFSQKTTTKTTIKNKKKKIHKFKLKLTLKIQLIQEKNSNITNDDNHLMD